MDKIIAGKLVNELKNQFRFFTLDEKLFSNLLTSVNVPESSRFYEVLPDNQQTIQASDSDHHFSLRRVLRNKNANDYQLFGLKRIYGAITSAFGAYSSDVLTRYLRLNKDVTEMMTNCNEPFSLLGKLETFDSSNPEAVSITTRPILVIPNVKERTIVDNWEKENMTYFKETRIAGLFPSTKRIKPFS